jgi:hypothetical protein
LDKFKYQHDFTIEGTKLDDNNLPGHILIIGKNDKIFSFPADAVRQSETLENGQVRLSIAQGACGFQLAPYRVDEKILEDGDFPDDPVFENLDKNLIWTRGYTNAGGSWSGNVRIRVYSYTRSGTGRVYLRSSGNMENHSSLFRLRFNFWSNLGGGTSIGFPVTELSRGQIASNLSFAFPSHENGLAVYNGNWSRQIYRVP